MRIGFGATHQRTWVGILLLAVLTFLPTAEAGVAIKGKGASFPALLYQRLAAQYQSIYPSRVTVSYEGTRSADGVDIVNKGYDVSQQYSFGASDVKPDGTDIYYFPSTTGAIALGYKIPGLVAKLQLTQQNVVDIFSGRVTTWNDASLLQRNPDLSNVTRPIQLIVRRAGSGTTKQFQQALRSFKNSDNFVALLDANLKANSTSPTDDWPWLSGALRAKSTVSVAVLVTSIDYTLCYLELTNTLESVPDNQIVQSVPVARVENALGEMVEPGDGSLRAAVGSNIDLDSNVLNSKNAGAYPLATFTYLLMRKNDAKMDDLTYRWTLRFLRWIVTSGTSQSLVPFQETREIRSGEMALGSNSNGTISTAASIMRDLTFAPIPTDFLRKHLNNMESTTFKSSTGTIKYGQSVCDYAPSDISLGEAPTGNNETRGCINSNNRCFFWEAFQEPSQSCICTYPNFNVRDRQCKGSTNDFAVQDSATVKGLQVLCLLGLLVVAATWYLHSVHRNEPTIKSVSPACNDLIFTGCVIGLVGEFWYSIVPTFVPACQFRPLLPAIAFALVFGMITMKTYRIYVVFGYQKISLSDRTMSNSKLILATLLITLFETIYVVVWMVLTKPRGNTVVVSAQDVQVLTEVVCTPAETVFGLSGNTVSLVFEIGLFAINGCLLMTAMVLAFQTRKAYERFQESKAIGMSVYTVTITLMCGIPIVYFLPRESETAATIVVFVRSIIFIISSVAIPLQLLGPKLFEVVLANSRKKHDRANLNGANLRVTRFMLTNKTSFSEPADDETNPQVASMENIEVNTVLFDVGVRPLRFGSAWQSMVLVLVPKMDFLFLFHDVEMVRLCTAQKLSSCLLELQSEGPMTPKFLSPEIRPRRSGMLQLSPEMRARTERMPPILSQSGGALNRRDENNQESQDQVKRRLILRPPRERYEASYLIEFSSEHRLRQFATLHDEARKRTYVRGIAQDGAFDWPRTSVFDASMASYSQNNNAGMPTPPRAPGMMNHPNPSVATIRSWLSRRQQQASQMVPRTGSPDSASSVARMYPARAFMDNGPGTFGIPMTDLGEAAMPVRGPGYGNGDGNAEGGNGGEGPSNVVRRYSPPLELRPMPAQNPRFENR
ncbi:hypothetical protein BJ742DRAFT_793413 [Cladochytrium replicatum]|nr:hypothetical protein BJ742DRAFT_793413 [Cladochytrium replicatum]